MLLATIKNTSNGRIWQITKCKGATAPACITGAPNMCGYWETRSELFEWACNVIGVNPDICEWVDGFTCEVLDRYELQDEHFDLMEG